MTSVLYPYLSGGILFSLLLQSTKQRNSAREKVNGSKDPITDQEILRELVSIINSGNYNPYNESFKTSANRYKQCLITSNTYLPFDEPSTIESFNQRFNSNDSVLLKSTSDFIDKYLSSTKFIWLVKAIIETIVNDPTIHESDTFEVGFDNKIKKKQLIGVTQVEIEIFILSVLNYILTQYRDNLLGRDTFLSWHQQKTKRGKWLFIKNNLGSSITQSIEIKRISPNESMDAYNTFEEIIEPEILTNSNQTDNETNKLQIVNNPKVIIQNAANIYNIEHVENLN